MNIKTKKNHTNGTRHQICLRKDILSKSNKLNKNLKIYLKAKAGRNKIGRITVRHQGSGCKQLKHIINSEQYYNAITVTTMYDPNRNSFLNLNFNIEKKTFFKTVHIRNVYPGTLINADEYIKEYKLGNKTKLLNLPLGSILNNVCLKYARSAGTFCQLLEKKNDKTKIRLPSGKIITLLGEQMALLGSIGNKEHKLIKVGKAGINRLKGIRPSVRGIAMNPVDHPHGGKSNKGMPPVTPWGLPTKNYPTVKKKKYE
jgi:large subunit ribosomal protein L2